MRTMMFLISCLSFTLSCFAAGSTHQVHLEGSWYHRKSDNWIEIRDEGKYISVLGLPPHGKARIFEREWKDVYLDKRGNKIAIENPAIIFYHHRSSGKVIMFERPAKARGNSPSCDTDDRHRDRGHHDRPRGNEYDSSRPHDYFRPTAQDIEGTWQALRGTDIAILTTRDGLRAKYSGTTRWVDYRMSNTNNTEFIDEKGNRYIFYSRDTATWFSSDRSNEPIKLVKKSNEVKY